MSNSEKHRFFDFLVDNGYFEKPASISHHGRDYGDLFLHSALVADILSDYTSQLPLNWNRPESPMIVGLFHDLCKVNFYTTEKRNRKNEIGKWESYDAYKIDEKFCFGGHGSKSVYIVQNFMKLKPEEAVSINCHMGAYDNSNVGNVYEKYPLAWLLHVADEAATYLMDGDC